MNIKEYFEILASQASDAAKKALWLRRSVKSPSIRHITLSQEILRADDTALEKIFTRLTHNELEAMEKVDSLSGKETVAQRQTVWSSVWAARATMSVAVLTLMGRPILVESQLAHGYNPKEIQHLKDKPVLVSQDPAEWRGRSLAYRKQSAEWRTKSTSFRTTGLNWERSFLLTELVSMAHQAYLIGDSTWPLRLQKPWYLDWEQVQKIPGLSLRPETQSKLQKVFSSLPITETDISALHDEPHIFVNPLTRVRCLDDLFNPGPAVMDDTGSETQQQPVPLIQISNPTNSISSTNPPPDWEYPSSGLTPLSSMPASPVPSDLSGGSGYGSEYDVEVDSFNIDG